ncbi:hypothetical protein DNTS_007672 [Danionella cerebrum]|uniref:Uncharacterized protein n=1 Tax=Danionella cerebrum TaxID=2873325 RepID=A0A553P5B2_9TELE|nr:hypothetical protein DNTS_007672 [Danionella translucida]
MEMWRALWTAVLKFTKGTSTEITQSQLSVCSPHSVFGEIDPQGVVKLIQELDELLSLWRKTNKQIRDCSKQKHPSIHLPTIHPQLPSFILLSLHSSNQLSICLSVNPPICPFIKPVISSSLCPPVHPSIQPTSYLSIHPSVRPSIQPQTHHHPQLHSFILLSLHSSNQLSICLSVNPPIHPSINPSIQPSVHPSIQPETHHPPTTSFIHPSVPPFIQPAIYLSVRQSTHLSIHPSIHLSIYQTSYLFIHMSISPSIHPTNQLHVHSPNCPSIHVPIRPFID